MLSAVKKGVIYIIYIVYIYSIYIYIYIYIYNCLAGCLGFMAY